MENIFDFSSRAVMMKAILLSFLTLIAALDFAVTTSKTPITRLSCVICCSN